MAAQFRFPKRSRATQLARANGAPGITAKLVEMREKGITGVRPQIVCALGLNYQDRLHHVDLFMHTFGAARLAELYSEVNHLTGEKVTEEDERAVTIVGELTAVHVYATMSCSYEQIMASRATLLSFLRSHPIPANEVKKYVVAVFKACKNLGSSSIPVADAASRVGPDMDGYPDELNMAKVRYFECRGNILKREMFTDESWDQISPAHAALCTLDVFDEVNINLPTVVEFRGDWPTLWSSLTDDERLALVEGVAMIHHERHACTVLLSTAACIANLTKQGNASPSWCANLMKRLEGTMTLVRDQELIKLTSEFFKDYHSIYPVPPMDPQSVYSLIQALYTLMTDSGVQVLAWILEQSAMHNITLAVEFCRVMNRHPHANIPYFLNKFATQVAAVAKLTGHMAYNRFASVIIPPVTMAEYPDLAFMAKYVGLQNRDPDKKIAYQGNPMAFATRTEEQLISLADQIIKEEIAIQSDQLALESRVNTLTAQIAAMTPEARANLNLPVDIAGKDMMAIGNDLYVIDPEDLQNHIDGLEEGERPAYRAEYARAKKSLWDRKAHILPPTAKKIGLNELSEMENLVDHGRISAFKNMCTTMESLSKQAVIDVIVENRNAGTTPYKPIPLELYNMLNSLNAGLDIAMTQPVRQNNDIPVTAYAQIDVLHRGNLPNPIRGGRRPPTDDRRGPRNPPNQNSGNNPPPEAAGPSRAAPGSIPPIVTASGSGVSFSTAQVTPFDHARNLIANWVRTKAEFNVESMKVDATRQQYNAWLGGDDVSDIERHCIIAHDPVINQDLFWEYSSPIFHFDKHPTNHNVFLVWSVDRVTQDNSLAIPATEAYECMQSESSFMAIGPDAINQFYGANLPIDLDRTVVIDSVDATVRLMNDQLQLDAPAIALASAIVSGLVNYMSIKSLAIAKDIVGWITGHIRNEIASSQIDHANYSPGSINRASFDTLVRNSIDQLVTDFNVTNQAD